MVKDALTILDETSIMRSELIGKSVSEATEYCKEHDITIRLVCSGGLITADFHYDRHDLEYDPKTEKIIAID